MRVLVFGNSGSGKSTYARALAARHNLARLELDTIVWETGRIAVRRAPEAIAESLRAFLSSHAAWVIEGCDGELIEAASPHCTELVFLNPGVEACLRHNRARPYEPHKFATPEQQAANDAPLAAWVAAYYTRGDPPSYAYHRRIFDAHPGAKVEHTAPV